MAATIVRRGGLLVLFPVVWLALPLVLDAVLSNAALTRYLLGGNDLADVERHQAALAWFDYLLPLLIGSVISYALALAAYFTVQFLPSSSALGSTLPSFQA